MGGWYCDEMRDLDHLELVHLNIIGSSQETAPGRSGWLLIIASPNNFFTPVFSNIG